MISSENNSSMLVSTRTLKTYAPCCTTRLPPRADLTSEPPGTIEWEKGDAGQKYDDSDGVSGERMSLICSKTSVMRSNSDR